MFDLGPGGRFSRESPSGWSHVWHTLNSLVLPVPHLYSAAFASLSINSKNVFFYILFQMNLCALSFAKSRSLYTVKFVSQSFNSVEIVEFIRKYSV